MAEFTITERSGGTPGFGGRTFNVDMGQIADEAIDAAAGALTEIGEEMLGLAKSYVPVDLGNLRASGDRVGVNLEQRSNSLTMSIGFGGGETSAYAVAIHEIPDTEFSPETQARRAAMGTGWKFLQRAVEETVPVVEERLAEGISARLEESL